MTKTVKDLLLILLLVAISTAAVWLPHILRLPNFWGLNFSNGFATIYRNFDGLEYIIIAKTFYNPSAITSINQPLSAIYFASHFPAFPILITLFAPFLGFLKSMLSVTLLYTALSAAAFYFLIKDFKLTNNPLFLTFLFLFLPARWLIVHSVGSSEPTFIFFIISSIYLFLKYEDSKKYYYLCLSVLSALGAQITRPPGILLFLALALFIHYQAVLQSKTIGPAKAFLNHLKYFPFLLVPIGLFAIFYFYGQTYQDFWAYFHSGDNIHLIFPPFQVFNKSQFWVGDIWLEDIVYIFILGFLGGVVFWKRQLYPLSFFVLTYLAGATLVVHRDISRYILPISPFILIAFEKVLTSKEFKIIIPIILIVIYLYSQNFILQNTAPIPNLQLYN